MLLRKKLWSLGYRYRIHYDIYGKPDIAFPKKKIAIFCDSEFWHGYDWAKQKEKFKNNKAYWFKKIEKNIDRDKKVNQKLTDEGWIVLRFWGKEIKKDLNKCIEKIVGYL